MHRERPQLCLVRAHGAAGGGRGNGNGRRSGRVLGAHILGINTDYFGYSQAGAEHHRLHCAIAPPLPSRIRFLFCHRARQSGHECRFLRIRQNRLCVIDPQHRSRACVEECKEGVPGRIGLDIQVRIHAIQKSQVLGTNGAVQCFLAVCTALLQKCQQIHTGQAKQGFLMQR